MSRRKKGNPVHGWVVLDKPIDMTSTQAVGAVRWLYQAQKAGHAGTLDPLATGILPIALGEATKTMPFVVDGRKSYRFTVRWGMSTTTDDTEGEAMDRSDARPSRADILSLLPRFVGAIEQVPPAYSAVKIAGQRAYDLARDGEHVLLAARTVVIDRLQLVGQADEDSAVFEADCGKGTYVRALARDFGRALGCFGHVTALRRTRVGPFDEELAVTLDELRLAAEPDRGGDIGRFLMPVESALADIPELGVSPSDAARLAQGHPVLVRGRDAPVLSGSMFATCKGRLVAVGEIERGALRPTRVFNLG